MSLISDMARAYALPGLKRAAGVVTRLLPIPQPTMMVGPGASARLGQAIGGFGHHKVLLVTDAVVSKLGLTTGLTEALTASGTEFVTFDEITPDAPIPLVEAGIALYQRAGCDAIVAFGGGSVMDAAKAIGLAAANDKHPRQLVGYFRGWQAPPPIYAVPTTAGTGSEVTVAAVISDPAHHRKLVIADTRIVPRMAALDPCLMTGLPPHITAATGMDALTHAVEAYIGGWGTAFTDRMALSAVGLIYQNLPVAFADGQDLAAREKMALASTYAGLAFTRANVGNVHAIAHQLGGLYHTPHGLANAIMLPPVLRFSSEAIQSKLAVLAVRAGLGRKSEPEAKLAQKFLDSVESMNRLLGIPKCLDALREKDIPALAKAACWEADTNYPVPRAMSRRQCEALLGEVLPAQARAAKAAAKKPVTTKGPLRKAVARKAPVRKSTTRRRTGAAA
jgi:alcohol dehydrogenase